MICSALLATALAATSPQTTVVVPLKAVGVPANDVSILTAELRTQIGRSERYRLVTPEEMSAVDEELTRQLSGGCDEASCVAELGGALGAKFLISGQVGKLGSLYTLQLKLIDIETVAAKRTASAHAAKIESLLLKLPEVASDLLGEQPSKRQVVVNATAKVASKLLEKVAERSSAQPAARPRPAPQPALASEEMGYLVLRTSYRPPAMLLGGVGLRLGRRFSANAAVGSGPEDNDTTTLWEADYEVALIGSQTRGGRLGFTMLYRNWSWGQGSASEPQTGSDLGAGAVAGFRHVLPSKLVFDVHMSAGFVSSETLEGGATSSQRGVRLINGGISLGWSPF